MTDEQMVGQLDHSWVETMVGRMVAYKAARRACLKAEWWDLLLAIGDNKKRLVVKRRIICIYI